jgi:hypothetical protein
MTVVLVLFAISVVSYVAAAILCKITDKWSELPHFVYNRVGGILGICSITDFKKTVPDDFMVGLSGEVRTFRRVRDTLAFVSPPLVDSPSSYFSGFLDNMRSWPLGGRFTSAEPSSQLFVPFTSVRFMSFDDQKKFFVVPQNPMEFSRAKIKENYKNDLRLWFAAYPQKRYLHLWKRWSIFASIVMLIVTLFIGIVVLDKMNNKLQITTIMAAKNGIQEIKTTRKELNHLLIKDPWYEITKGKAMQPLYVGGGLSRVCVNQSHDRTRCGFADSSLRIKEGDEIYIYEAKLLLWTNGKVLAGDSDGSWLITKSEAESLVTTGKFKIVD